MDEASLSDSGRGSIEERRQSRGGASVAGLDEWHDKYLRAPGKPMEMRMADTNKVETNKGREQQRNTANEDDWNGQRSDAARRRNQRHGDDGMRHRNVDDREVAATPSPGATGVNQDEIRDEYELMQDSRHGRALMRGNREVSDRVELMRDTCNEPRELRDIDAKGGRKESRRYSYRNNGVSDDKANPAKGTEQDGDVHGSKRLTLQDSAPQDHRSQASENIDQEQRAGGNVSGEWWVVEGEWVDEEKYAARERERDEAWQKIKWENRRRMDNVQRKLESASTVASSISVGGGGAHADANIMDVSVRDTLGDTMDPSRDIEGETWMVL